MSINVYPIRSVRTARFKYILNILPGHFHTNHLDILRNGGAGEFWDSWDRAAKTDQRAASIVRKYFERPAEELFDLAADRLEQTNLADPSHAHRKERMRAMLDE